MRIANSSFTFAIRHHMKGSMRSVCDAPVPPTPCCRGFRTPSRRLVEQSASAKVVVAFRQVHTTVARADLNLVGLAMRAERKVIDKSSMG
jgi:hypothetical protein